MSDSAAPATLPHDHWTPTVDAARVFSRSEAISYLRPGPRKGFWFLLSQPEEGNAQALMYLDADNQSHRVSPPGFNLRSRVHEYGGLPYAAGDDTVYYVHFSDQRLYRQTFDPASGHTGTPEPLTPATGPLAALRYEQPLLDHGRHRLIAVREDHRRPEDVRNTLVSIDLTQAGEGEILFDGSDFVTAPRLSPDGGTLVFLSWNHPGMPWDHTTLHIADLDPQGRPRRFRTLQGQENSALVQPLFGPNGDLYVMSDRDNWWTPWRVSATDLQGEAPEAKQAVALEAECCSPPWQGGNRQMAVIDEHRLLLTVIRQGLSDLVVADSKTGQRHTLLAQQGQIEPVLWRDGRAVAIVAGRQDTPAILSLDPDDESAGPRVLKRCHSDARLPAEQVSTGEPIHYATGDGEQAHGVFYTPRNPACRAPEGERPPLIVAVHGGPTGCARTGYNPAIQYWTSRGFAYFDVNHRGSTGFGRRFRHALYGQWGVVDVEDIINGVQALIERGAVDPERIVIRGGSAGGYAVLAALVHSDLFSAGTSHYGVSDLSLLAADTHKFESRYLDQLIGPWPEAEAIYRERSPIHHIDRINAPVLLLQGSEDKVVPPNQAEAIFERLKARNPQSDYIVFQGEGHGFRQPANQIHALESELAFYQHVLW
ncbi:MAG: S9 family peptidase [Pseudohongiellaceae bacterium]